ncbi:MULTISPECIES: AI-2E family transporter [Thermomonosporaceae]|uniref:AI-2E family transporter n=1 Tax=Thermomonosporaceae TaxID=2012 RepID=UPI00255A85D9|nr:MULTISPECIES: AI-2E family transporter [Thermomonosporaceae]MDL4776646.1 AI-2E family transporter [Actinomadura xylanilytica]
MPQTPADPPPQGHGETGGATGEATGATRWTGGTEGETPPPGTRGGGTRRMPPWLPRAFLLAGGTVLLFVAGLWLLERLRGLLLLLLTSLFIAFAIEPAVTWLAARGWRRGLATGAMFLLIALLVGGFFGILGSLVVAQATNLVNGLPGYIDEVIGWINDTTGAHLSQATLFDKLPSAADQLSRHLSSLAGNVWGIGATAIGVLFQGLGILLFTFYLSAQGPQFRRTVCSLLPPHRQRQVLWAWEIAVAKTGGYIYSRALLALISGIAHFAALSLLHVPYALTLALWVGVVSQFIPTVGTYLAGAVPVLVGLAHSPSTALWVLLFITAYQQLENYLLQPRITARTLDMHPAVAFGTVLAGTAIIGPVGALLALPVCASLQAFLGAYIRRYTVEEHPLTTPARRRPRPRRRRPRDRGPGEGDEAEGRASPDEDGQDRRDRR